MLENDISIEGADSTTPVTPEPIETPETQAETQTESDLWANIGNETEEEGANEGTTDTPVEKTEEKTEKPADEPAEKPLEEQVLEEIFKDDAEKPGESEDMDDKEVLERQRNATARAAAERNLKKAAVVKDFQYPDKETGEFKPIAEVAKRLEEANSERYVELTQYAAHQLVDANPEATFKRAYAVKMLAKDPNFDVSTIPSLDDLIANKTTATVSETPTDLKEITAELDSAVEWDWRDASLDENFLDERELALVKTARALEAKAKDNPDTKALETKVAELEAQLTGLSEGKVSEAEQVITQERERLFNDEITSFRTSIRASLLPHILKTAGLEVTKEDTPAITAFKERKQKLFDGDEPAFETFAFEESSVKQQLYTVAERIGKINAQIAEAKRLKQDDSKFREQVADERIPFMQLLGQASKEFVTREILPEMELIAELSGKLATPLKEASERVEVTGSSNGTQTRKEPNYETVDDVFAAAVSRVAEDERLRAA